MACPECGEPLQTVFSAELIVGYRLVAEERTDALPVAVAVALPFDSPRTEPH